MDQYMNVHSIISTVFPNWKQSKRPPTEEGPNKRESIQTMGYYSAIKKVSTDTCDNWRNLRNMLSEARHTGLLILQDQYKCLENVDQKRRKAGQWFPGVPVEAEWAKRTWGHLWCDGNVLKLDRGYGCMTL